MALRIRGWDKHYENNRSRELKRPEWLPLPNTFDGRGYMELCDHPAGMSHYGAWCMLLAAASRMPTRGLLLSDSGHPLTLKDVARMTRGSQRTFEEALPRLIEIGWVEEVDVQPVEGNADSEVGSAVPSARLGSQDADKSRLGAAIPQPGANMCRQKGKEKGKEKEKGNSGCGSALPPHENRDQPGTNPGPTRVQPGAEPQQPPPDQARQDNLGDLLADPKPKGIVHREKTFGDFLVMHPRIFVGKDERDTWEALFARFEWDNMDEGYTKLIDGLPKSKHVFFSAMSKWLNDTFDVKES